MQKLIAKYGLAAHLALLAAAPLLLSPFCSDTQVATVLLWLTLSAALWMVLEPSLRSGEYLRDARRRVFKAMLRDPLFWATLVLAVFAGVRALNTGIALAYDAEAGAWRLSTGPFPILPGVVGSAGDLPFAATMAVVVLLQACRHSLGRSARMVFMLLSSALAGLSAVIALVAVQQGHSGAQALLPHAGDTVYSFVGFAFGLYLSGGILALVAIVEHRWNEAYLLLPLSIGGTAAGMFAFSPTYLSAALAVVALVTFVYAVSFAGLAFAGVGGLKMVVIGVVSLAVGGLLIAVFLPPKLLAANLEAFAAFKLLPSKFLETWQTLSAVSLKSWVAHPWIGTGLGSFPLDFRFHAEEAQWGLFPGGVRMPPSGWWLMLAERGIVGAVFFALPFGFLLFTYVHRLLGWVKGISLPHPACLMAPLLFFLFVLAGFFDCSPLRTEAYMAMGVFLAVSAAAFPRIREI